MQLGWLEQIGLWVLMVVAAVFPGANDVPDEARETVEIAMATSSYHVAVRVIDGDTIDIDNGERVRLYGIDTPERGECYFTESTEFLRQWIEGETVRLEKDVRERDVHDRLLRYIFVDTVPDGAATSTEQLVNLELVQAGYARSLPIGPDRRYRSAFYAAQQEAQADARGKWQACSDG